MGGEGKPKYGYGKGGRPLWSARDREAEVIRDLLRLAGHREFEERRGGFVVEGGNGLDPYLVTCTDWDLVHAGELTRYAEVLRATGWHVLADPGDDQVLEAWRA